MADQSTPESNQQRGLTRIIQYGLFVIAAVSVLCALLHAVAPDRFDQDTALFLGLAIAALVVHQITKLKFGSFEFEKEVERKVEQLQTQITGLEKDVGPGSKVAGIAPAAHPVQIRTAQQAPEGLRIDPEDPNKGQFGGLAERNGRRLAASIQPLAGRNSARCEVHFKVESTDPARPLTGKVRFHLHPTFGRWTAYDVDVKDGVAEDEIVSYGAFTIGAEADDGETRLELDLMSVRGGTDRFYAE